MDPGSTKPSWRSGNTHGFCVTGGHPPIASEPTPSPRLWAAAPGATPVRLCEHTMRVGDRTPKTGTFYLAGNRNFLFGSDSGICGICGICGTLTRASLRAATVRERMVVTPVQPLADARG